MEMPQPVNQIEPLKSPHGLTEIIATFGDIHEYVGPDGQLDPRWQTDFLARIRAALSAAAGLGPVANHRPDDLPPAHDLHFAAVFDSIQHAACKTEIPLWRVFCFPSSADRQ